MSLNEELFGRVEVEVLKNDLCGLNDVYKDIADEIGSTYVITHGADGKWTKGSSKTLGFTANGLFKLFKEVRVDGNVLVKDTDYTAISGSTIVTLKQSYLDTLSVGKHKLEVFYDILGEEHIADCEFTIKAKPAPATQATPAPTDNVPKTGDSTNTVGWMILMLSSMAALTVVFKKKKEYEDR
jgi:LPXTG-motif cell wall-anchored protein